MLSPSAVARVTLILISWNVACRSNQKSGSAPADTTGPVSSTAGDGAYAPIARSSGPVPSLPPESSLDAPVLEPIIPHLDLAMTPSADVATLTPPQPRPLPLLVAGGRFHTCVIGADHLASCWGRNARGQLGDGGSADRSVPGSVVALGRVSSLAVGGARGAPPDGHTCAVLEGAEAGQIRCWGANDVGQLGDGSTMDRERPTPVAQLTTAVEVGLGVAHACARTRDGAVLCWGSNRSGQLGDGTLTDSPVPVRVKGLADVIELAVGHYHACVRRSGGDVLCWGPNSHGELGDGGKINKLVPVAVTGLADAIEVAAGASHSCARRAVGTTVCWGANDYGDLGDGTRLERLAPTAISGLGDRALQLARGAAACARMRGGTVLCWGSGVVGQLGDGAFHLSAVPVAVKGLDDAVTIGGTCAIRTTGAVVCWGGNESGQLGDGTMENRNTPVPVRGLGEKP